MKNTPKLRFPEFLDDGEWEEKTLKELAENLDNKRVPITSNVRSKGNIPYYGASGIVDFVNDYIFDEELLCISEDGANLVARTYPIAFSISGKTWVNNHAHVLKFQNKCTQLIVENYLNSIKLDDFLTGMAQPKLNKAMLDIIPIPISSKPKEQQKIANCLSSVDNLITAQSKKVETLKEHKKALMQQLFPQDGEEVPKLRFPEFKNAPKWEEKKISDICDKPYSGGTPSSTNKEFYGGSIPFIRSAEINKEKTELFLTDEGLKNSSAKLVKKGDVLIALYGANSGDVAISKIDGAINQAILCLNSEDSNPFLFQYLTLKKDWIVAKYIQGGQGNLSGEIVKSIQLDLPKAKEQQKIANFLSSIDELITSSTKKVETLKEHKKALMQQLFPSNNTKG